MNPLITLVVGARPNFMKIAPLMHAFAARAPDYELCLVHTGQHYDDAMSEAFFTQLGIPTADVHLGVGSGTHAEQVGRTMIKFEKVLRARRPNWVVVVGDVNATCACAITAKQEHIRLAHVEAGLRSFDWSMPEEVNRVVTDRLADFLFTPDAMADANLEKEGVTADRIHRVGNIMIDTLESQREAAAALDPSRIVADALVAPRGTVELTDKGYALLTMHRPGNVDTAEVLAALAGYIVDELSSECPVVWPIHPRTQKNLEAAGLWERVVGAAQVLVTRPLDYRSMLRLNQGARVCLTDSGGLQEECCVLGTPCLTMRDNTERPITLVAHGGCSLLVGNDVGRIRAAMGDAEALSCTTSRPPLWDGQTANRIVDAFVEAG